MKFDRRISRRSFLAAAGVSAAALALTACGGSSSTVASGSTAASGAAASAEGGVLNVMLETEVQSLDPQLATDGTSFEVIANYTDCLLYTSDAADD